MHESLVVSFSQKALVESGAWCIFTAFWGEQQAVAAIVAAACIFCARSCEFGGEMFAALRLNGKFSRRFDSGPQKTRRAERWNSVRASDRWGWADSTLFLLAPGAGAPSFASVDARLG